MHCSHGHNALTSTDSNLESDEFTRAALSERRARAAHAHFGAIVMSVVGALFFAHVFKAIHRRGN